LIADLLACLLHSALPIDRGELDKQATDLFFAHYLERKKQHGFVDPAFVCIA
jgi:hypothetical protein